MKIEGGDIYNVNGGPGSNTARADINDIFIFMAGGKVGFIFGGAGQNPTYGNRIVSVTGGTVEYSVFGGSNAYDGGEGTINGSSLVYIGGNAQIGDPINTEGLRFNASKGNVFGIGNGRTGDSSIGSNDNSKVIIDGDAHLLRNVYGGGNYAAVGVYSTASTTNADIEILGGTIAGSVYGGGYYNGAGDSSAIAAVNIEVTGGNILRKCIWRK